MTFESGKTQLCVRFSFAAVITLMLIFCDEGIVLMSFLSSVLHECGHLFLMRLFGERISRVELGLFGMRIEKQGDNLCYKKEALAAMGGIIVNFILLCIFSFIGFFYKSTYCSAFAFVNLLIIAVNMLPVRVLDFGRCIYCLLCERLDSQSGERIIDLISFIFAVSLNVFCIIYCFCFKLNISLIAVSLYLDIITFKKKWS